MPKGENDNYHLGQLNRPVSQIDIQRNMVGFVMDRDKVQCHVHILYSTCALHHVCACAKWLFSHRG